MDRETAPNIYDVAFDDNFTPELPAIEFPARREQIAEWIQASLKPVKHLLEEGLLEELDDDVNEEAQGFETRETQLEAWGALWNTRHDGATKALIHMATGLGKTSVAVFDVIKFREEFRAEHGREPRVLFTCNRNEIIEQAAERFEAFIPDLSQGFYAGADKERDADITFATLQSLYGSLKEFDPEEFDYIIYDEAHHNKAETFEAVVTHFQPSFQLALTATPDRLDEENIRELFGHEIYSKGLAQALAEGLLATPDYHIVFDDAVKAAMESGFEPDTLAELNQLFANKPRNEVIARNIKEEMGRIGLEFGDVKTIVFCQNIDHAEEMAKLLDGEAYHSGIKNKKEKRRILENFKNGENQIICTRDMFNEGVDIPDARLLVFLRSTSSQTIFEQQLGRGLRKYTGKEIVSVFDFVANVERIAMVRELAENIKDYSARYGYGREDSYDPHVEWEGQPNDDAGIQLHTNHGDFDFDRLSVDLLAKFEVLKQDNAPDPPDNYLSISSAAKEMGVGPPVIMQLVEDMEWELPVYKFRTRVTQGISTQQMRQLRETYPERFVEVASEEYYSINSASQKFKIGPKILERLIDNAGFELPLRKFGPKTTRAITPSQIQQLRDQYPDEFAPLAPENILSTKSAAKELGVDFYTVRRIIDEKEWELPKYRFKGGVISGGLSSSQIKELRRHPLMDNQQVDESIVSVAALARELGVATSTVQGIMETHGISSVNHRFGRGRRLGEGVNESQAEVIRNNVIPPMPKDWVRLTTAAKKLGVKIDTFNRILSDLDIQLEERMANSKKGFAVSPEQFQTIESSERYQKILQRRR